MGTLLFLIPNKKSLAPYSVDTAHLIGFDGVPWQTQGQLMDEVLLFERDDKESARLVIPWQTDEDRVLTLSTGTLAERNAPYHLPIELARGIVNQIRNQLAAWNQIGFELDLELQSQVKEATQCLIDAISSDDKMLAAEHADRCISLACGLITGLSEAFSAFEAGHEQANSACWFGGILPTKVPPDSNARFQTMTIPFQWDEIERNQDELDWQSIEETIAWARPNKIHLMGGPFLDLSKDQLPDWLYLWQDDFESIESLTRRYIETSVRRFQDYFHLWHCQAATSVNSKLGFTEEQRLRLTVAAIESVRKVDTKTPLLVVVDQPWGEYMAAEDIDLAPLQLADMIARADIGVTGFGIRFSFGSTLNHTLLRDPLSVNRLIQIWSHLGKPLVVIFDEIDSTESEVAIAREIINDCVELLRYKPAVQGIILADQWSDLVETGI